MKFFNSSMPRSGSTLLQNILGQNPNIHVTPTDGFLELIYGARVNFTNNAEFKAQDQDQMFAAWRGFCNSGLDGYCKGLSSKPNTCIKSRGIGANYDWFKAFMGEDPKVIVMVRDIKAVLASMEKMHRANPERSQQIQDPSNMSGLTTESRVQKWLQGPPVGLALQRLQQMRTQGVDRKCHYVRFEDLTSRPFVEIQRVYKYLDLPEFTHNFSNVEQITQEDDAVYGMTANLHTVRPKVESLKPDYIDILGEGLCNWIDDQCAGYQYDHGYKN
jgi:sulfotransferase